MPMSFQTREEPVTSKRLIPKGYLKKLYKSTDFGYSMFHSMGSKEIDDWHYFKLRRGYDMKIRKQEEQLDYCQRS